MLWLVLGVVLIVSEIISLTLVLGMLGVGALVAAGIAYAGLGTALQVAGGDPRLGQALQDAFMSGFSTSCVVVGVVCLVGAVAALFWLPGREVVPTTPGDSAPEVADRAPVVVA